MIPLETFGETPNAGPARGDSQVEQGRVVDGGQSMVGERARVRVAETALPRGGADGVLRHAVAVGHLGQPARRADRPRPVGTRGDGDEGIQDDRTSLGDRRVNPRVTGGACDDALSRTACR